MLIIEIDEQGQVVYAELAEPAGHGFDEAAMEAVQQFTFSPALDSEGPVPVIIEFAYGFVLDVDEHEGALADEQALEDSPVELPVNLEGQLVEMGTRRSLPDFPVLLTEL